MKDALSKRLEGYVKKRLTTEEITDREGISSVSTLNKKLKSIADRLGITRNKASLIPYKVAYGLTSDSIAFRRRLAWRIDDLVKEHGADETARKTGLSRVQQKQANFENRKVDHNWTLAQLERLARAKGVSFPELMKGLLVDN